MTPLEGAARNGSPSLHTPELAKWTNSERGEGLGR